MAVAALALFAGVVTLFAAVPNIVGTIFDGKFELGPGNGNAGTGAEVGVTNIRADGNLGTGPDWADQGASSPTGDGLFDKNGFVVGTCGSAAGCKRNAPILGGEAAFVSDDLSAGSLVDRTTYAGGPGDKNSDVIADWTWATSSVPAKDDIANAYTYTKVVTASDGTSHKLLFVGVEREDPSGDSHVDVEFFQSPVGLDRNPLTDPCPSGKCKFTGANSNNDLLVNMDFTNGGGFGTVSVRRRDSSVKDDYTVQETLTGEGCSSTHDVCGFNNGASILNGATSTSDGWRSADNHATVVTSLLPNAFTEIGLDVTALGFGNPCFSTVQVKTRSSQSFTATLKDFALQGFQQCFASVATEMHDGVSVGPTHSADDIEIGATCTGPNCGRGYITVGDTIHDKIIVTGQPGFAAPSGTITLHQYTNPTTDNPCSGSDSTGFPKTLTLTAIASTNPPISAVEGGDFTATVGGGTVSYLATYNGDSSYTQPTPPSSCETVRILKIPSQLITSIYTVSGDREVLNGHIENNTAVYDEAFVYGGVPFVAGTGVDPTGTVTFHLYTTGDCSGAEVVSTILGFPDTETIQNDSSGDKIAHVKSRSVTPTAAAGSFICFKAEYSGDGRYSKPDNPSTVEPLCAFTSVPNNPNGLPK